jgi:hypothetical protein
VLNVLNNYFRTFPQEFWASKKNDRSTTVIFAGVTSAGKLILLEERVRYDPVRAKRFPNLVAGSRVIAVDETLIMGSGSIDTYAELSAASSPRAATASALLLALDHPPTLPVALQTAQSFIATTESWYPGESGGDIAELAFSPLGVVWTSRSSTCR